MLNIEINKEIKGDNKIIANLNFRQTIVSAIAGVILLVLYFSTKEAMPLEYFMLVAAIVGAIAWWFGWHTKSGLKGEQHLYIIIKNKIEGNKGRIYATKNKYVSLINDNKKNNKDSDKMYHKEKKQQAKSKLKPII